MINTREKIKQGEWLRVVGWGNMGLGILGNLLGGGDIQVEI